MVKHQTVCCWQQRHRIIAAFLLIVLTFTLQDGYLRWTANLSLLKWTHSILSYSPSDRVEIPNNTAIRVNLLSPALVPFGRISFAQEEYLEAAAYYERAHSFIETNPIALAEMAIALSRTDQFEKTIDLYEAKGEMLSWKRQARYAVSIAYLHQLDERQRAVSEVLPTLQDLVPQALYVRTLSLLQEHSVGHVSELPAEAQRTLARFPIEAIMPDDARMLDYTARIIPDLLASGIWNRERLQNVMLLWIWQYPDSPAIDYVLETVAANYGEIMDWSSLKTELDLRRRQQGEDTSSGLARAQTNDTSNMLANGGFDVVNYEGLVGWHVADYITGRGIGEPQAAFLMDVDGVVNISPPNALRLDGIWDDAATGFYGATALRYGSDGTNMLFLMPHQPYRVFGYYRTGGDSEQASVYIGNPSANLIDHSLLSTAGEWRTFEYVGCHTSEQVEAMQLLLRLHNSGTVWFDDLVLRPADMDASGNACSP